MVITTLAAMTAGYILSVILGTPKAISAHRLISALCNKLAPWLSGKYQDSEEGQRTGGVFYAVLVMLILLLPTAAVLFVLYRKIPALALAFDGLLCWSVSDIKSHSRLSQAAARNIRGAATERAARFTSKLCRLDCSELESEDIVRAAVQGTADRTVDQAAAPLLYMFVLSGLGGLFFRITDSGSDIDLGENTAAFLAPMRKLRDNLCFLPGKLAAAIMLVDALFLKLNTRGGERILKSDSRKCTRVAFGSCRAVLAGVLGISLLPEEVFTAQFMRTFTIGEHINEPDAKDITLSNQLMLGTAFIIMLLLFAIKLTAGILLY